MNRCQRSTTWSRVTMLTALALLTLNLRLLPAGEPAKLDPKAVANLIDKAIDQQLKAEKVTASSRSDDAEFLRRVYLDITGQIPSAEKALAFLDSKDADKRAKLIDELLASPEYGKHQADIWQSLMLTRTSDNRRQNFQPMGEWLEKSFNENKPWNTLVKDIITATGSQDKNGAVTFYLSNVTVDKMTDTTAKLFLGVQLQCAQCHNHPFIDWKQTEYWGMAAFFMKVQVTAARNPAQNSTPPSISETSNPRRGRNALPESAKKVPAKFFRGEEPKVTSSAPLRPVLADWMTSPKNPFFSKAIVNRVWHQFYGRGLVNPVDDMNDNNAASHPELLASLSQQFADGGFDVKALIRGICNSESYQRTSKPTSDNAEASPSLYSHMAVKVLPPGQLFDAFTKVVGAPGRGPAGRAAGAGPRAGNPRDQFIAFFGLEDGSDSTEYQAGIPQALRLMNGPQFNNGALTKARQIGRAAKTPQEAVEKLFLTALSRRPSEAESKKMLAYVEKHASDKDKAYADVLWVLINTSEFTLNR